MRKSYFFLTIFICLYLMVFHCYFGLYTYNTEDLLVLGYEVEIGDTQTYEIIHNNFNGSTEFIKSFQTAAGYHNITYKKGVRFTFEISNITVNNSNLWSGGFILTACYERAYSTLTWGNITIENVEMWKGPFYSYLHLIPVNKSERVEYLKILNMDYVSLTGERVIVYTIEGNKLIHSISWDNGGFHYLEWDLQTGWLLKYHWKSIGSPDPNEIFEEHYEIVNIDLETSEPSSSYTSDDTSVSISTTVLPAVIPGWTGLALLLSLLSLLFYRRCIKIMRQNLMK